jgi:hypothetical protein
MRGPDNPNPSTVLQLRNELLASTRRHPLEPGHMMQCAIDPAPLPLHPNLYLSARELAEGVLAIPLHRVSVWSQVPGAGRDENGTLEFLWDATAAWLRQNPQVLGRAG